MKKILTWSLGPRGSRVAIASWNWLWGKPIESGGKIAVEVATASLAEIQQSISLLTESVAKITANYQRVKNKLEEKQKEYEDAKKQVILAHRNRMKESARTAMSKVISIEKVLPHLTEQVHQAEQILQVHQEQLNRSRQQLQDYQVELQNLQDLAEVNEALTIINELNTELDVNSAKSQFREAGAAIKNRNLQVRAFAELSIDPVHLALSDLDQLAIDNEITKRLAALDAHSIKMDQRV
jgi:phage shock protein A